MYKTKRIDKIMLHKIINYVKNYILCLTPELCRSPENITQFDSVSLIHMLKRSLLLFKPKFDKKSIFPQIMINSKIKCTVIQSDKNSIYLAFCNMINISLKLSQKKSKFIIKLERPE